MVPAQVFSTASRRVREPQPDAVTLARVDQPAHQLLHVLRLRGPARAAPLRRHVVRLNEQHPAMHPALEALPKRGVWSSRDTCVPAVAVWDG
eukprot:368335-Prymnesium_polylepis.2